MKKGFAILIIVIIACVFSYFMIVNHKNKNESHVNQVSKVTHEKLDDVEKQHGYKLYRPEQTVKVKGAKLDLTSNEHSNESAVIKDMHDMTHQKVQAEFKEGAIEMTPAHVNTVYRIVNKSTFTHREELLAILSKWKQKEFNEIVEDHNFLWKIQGGKIGKATDRLTTREEKEFIENNFR